MDALLRARAAGQAGLVTRAQALAAGLSPKAVEWRLRRGRWVAVLPGVYQTTPGREGWEVRAVAALLHTGPGAALCGDSAGHLWGLVRHAPDRIEVVVPAGRRPEGAPGVAVRRSRYAAARVDPRAWPHRTTAEDTVLDLATGAGPDRFVALAARAVGSEITTLGRLRAALAARARYPGRAAALEVLGVVAEGAESPAERRYHRDVERAHGLPRGRAQTPFGRAGRRDVEYEGVVVEVDGRLGHGGWREVQRDGRRDRAALAGGLVTVRCYWADLVPSACSLAAEVAAILQARGWSGSPRRCGPGCVVDG